MSYRQIALINRALKKSEGYFTVESHKGAHNVSYDTARTDLLKLVELGLLEKTIIGKAFAFTSVSDLKNKLKALDS